MIACRAPASEQDGAFYNWDGRKIHCAIGLDDNTGITHADIDGALDRAVRESSVVELYAHYPGVTVAQSTIDHVLEAATARGLAWVTYPELARDAVPHVPSIALSFDDHRADLWLAIQPRLAAVNARLTFFASYYEQSTAEERAAIHALAEAGHAIEAHSVLHLRAPDYVEKHGLAAYLTNEAQPSIDVLEADGFPITTYAYPFGSRTNELDEALLQRVTLLRSIVYTLSVANEPCPD